MKYAEMSDFEINKAVSKYFKSNVFLNSFGEPVSLEPDTAATYTGKDFDEVPFDPCNSWADAGPIIEENRISIIPESDGIWFALGGPQIKNNWRVESTGAFHNETTPLRAAMIVFLMMQEAE